MRTHLKIFFCFSQPWEVEACHIEGTSFGFSIKYEHAKYLGGEKSIPAGHYLLFGRLERPKEGSSDISFKSIHEQVGGKKL